MLRQFWMAAGLPGWLETIGFGQTGGSGRVGMDAQEAVVDPTAQGGPMMTTQESAVDP